MWFSFLFSLYLRTALTHFGYLSDSVCRACALPPSLVLLGSISPSGQLGSHPRPARKCYSRSWHWPGKLRGPGRRVGAVLPFLTLPARMRLPTKGSPSVSEVTQASESYYQKIVGSRSFLCCHGENPSCQGPGFWLRESGQVSSWCSLLCSSFEHFFFLDPPFSFNRLIPPSAQSHVLNASSILTGQKRKCPCPQKHGTLRIQPSRADFSCPSAQRLP